jgi:DNA-binding transcriptional ArsR family regulator
MITPHEPRLARVAAIVADPARSRMLAYLLSGEYASASELAKVASVAPATASGHLGKLLDARFVVCEPRGRHRYYRLADAEVAHALEALALVAERDMHDRAWVHRAQAPAPCTMLLWASGRPAGRDGIQALQRGEQLKPTPSGYERRTPAGNGSMNWG